MQVGSLIMKTINANLNYKYIINQKLFFTTSHELKLNYISTMGPPWSTKVSTNEKMRFGASGGGKDKKSRQKRKEAKSDFATSNSRNNNEK